MQTLQIEKLASPEPAADWHDAPYRWIVKGPGTEAQKFPTKREATLYKRIRSRSASFIEATRVYAATV
jgi:hypothetical protein